QLARARQLAQRTVREARRLIAGLRPTALDDFGLTRALDLEIEDLRAEGWQIDFEPELEPERLPPLVETALFRVAQEALTNVRKHARTTRAELSLRCDSQRVVLTVRDWGCGLASAASSDSPGCNGHFGLLSMHERVLLATRSLGRLAHAAQVLRGPPERLSPREHEVLQLLARGQTKPEIARALGLSVRTVKAHVEHILAKLAAGDRTHAAARPTELGLLSRSRP
ncbi:MAG: LuxR C-terminal-related transcriptional regulator, partial [Chloroflexota bacterium]|nr:LuxR C-terminal-related transcriptional regulator [Chloroflexota bacterium]